MSKKPVNESLRGILTKEMFEEVEDTFKMVCDSRGIMPQSKLNLALKALGMSLHDADDAKIPNDIDLDAFIELIEKCLQKPNWAANEMGEVFAIIDKDRSGNIDPNEVRRILTRLGENVMELEIEDQLRQFDKNGDYEVL
jgi:Ca2+-binding EF-hand superfamily protein